MAFTDPQTITINAVPATLPRTGLGVGVGTFESNDGLTSLSISHTKGRRDRHIVRLDVSKIAADPFAAGINSRVSMSVQLHVDIPKTGYTVADQAFVVKGLTDFLTTARVNQVLGNES